MVTQQDARQIERSFRAKQIARRPGAVCPRGNGIYLIESQYHPSRFYRADLGAGTCECEDFQRRRPAACKHLIAAEEAEKASKRRRVIVDDWDPATGRIIAWHDADEPTAPAPTPAAAADRQRQTQQVIDELFPF